MDEEPFRGGTLGGKEAGSLLKPMPELEAAEVTVGIPVTDLSRARGWYERVLGRPPELEPMPGILEWKVGGAWLQLEEGTARPGGWTFRIGVQNLKLERSRLVELGLQVSDVTDIPGVIQFFDFADPDGNKLSIYELARAP